MFTIQQVKYYDVINNFSHLVLKLMIMKRWNDVNIAEYDSKSMAYHIVCVCVHARVSKCIMYVW